MNNWDKLSYDSTSGEIYCVYCSRNSPRILDCAHVLGAFYDNTDLTDMWDLFPIEVMIPIASKYNVWAKVEIDGFAAGPPNTLGLVRWEGEDVCIIGRSEGRLVIRSALLSHMYGDVKFKDYCVATTHGVMEEKIWARQVRQGDPNSTERVAQLWTVYSTGLCIPCNLKIEQALNDATPERQGDNVWNR